MNEQQVKIAYANPTPIGALGLAIVTLGASMQKLGITQGVSMLIPWVIVLGGFAQVIASVIDYKKENVFGATAFGAYGLFWIAVGFAWLISLGVFGEQAWVDIDLKQLTFAFVGYLVFSIFLLFASFNTNKVFIAIVSLVILMLACLVLNGLGVALKVTKIAAGVIELCIAVLGFYASAAFLLNSVYKKVILPIGKPLNVFNKND